MANRNIHYEAAFESYLRNLTIPYVSVDEAKKAAFGKVSLKSFDFIVYGGGRANLLVDVKGRKFPDMTPGKRKAGRPWENWVTRDDIEGMKQWQEVFGWGFQAILVFAYWVQGEARNSPFDDIYFFNDKQYAFVAISLADYISLARPRSKKWQTMDAPTAEFSKSVKDITNFL